ncbi:MAG: Glycosyl hydrolase 53 domain protein, partial [Candidatus Yanofskybacteria bacterium GW2011_GWA2_44_9]
MTKNKILRILLITFVLFVGILGITRESKAFVVVPPGPVIGTTSYLQTGTVNQVYSPQHIQVSGGISPYTWDVVSGVLPPGLSLGVSTGMISGTPNTVDTFNFTVQVIDGNFETALQNFTLAIAPVSETGFLYTRNPPGSVIVSPVATRIQGV